ncbi:MAG: hypothetical protein JXB88_05065 [Spirochaetales bacterium]|nr:hypothetical protein [Spirochaetales bacterium]
MKGRVQQILFIIILLFFIFPLYPDSEKLTITLWGELEPLITLEGEEYPLSENEVIRRVLEHARVIFSAMIYGYGFAYTPYDKQRGISEYFQLEPFSEIKWGDPHLKIIASRIIEKRLYVTISYRCMDFQASRREAWKSLAVPAASGQGTGDYFKGYTEMTTSFKNALKEAIRDYMRKRTFNKPKEIKGEVLLLEMPGTIIRAGEYITTAKIKVNIKEVIPYKVF